MSHIEVKSTNLKLILKLAYIAAKSADGRDMNVPGTWDK